MDLGGARDPRSRSLLLCGSRSRRCSPPLRMGSRCPRRRSQGRSRCVMIGVAGSRLRDRSAATSPSWQPRPTGARRCGALVLADPRGRSSPHHVTRRPYLAADARDVGALGARHRCRRVTPRCRARAWSAQTYDNVFHLSAIASILEHGRRVVVDPAHAHRARPRLRLLSVRLAFPRRPHGPDDRSINSGRRQCGVARCQRRGLAARSRRGSRRSACPASLPRPRHRRASAGAAFGAMPYALLTWGTLYPTFLATALLPAAVAVPVLAWRGWRAARPTVRGRGRRLRSLRRSRSPTAASRSVSLGCLATWALLLAIPVIGVVVTSLRAWLACWEAGARASVGVTLVGAVATSGRWSARRRLWYLRRTSLGLFERPLDDRLGGPQAEAIQPIWLGGRAGARAVLAHGGGDESDLAVVPARRRRCMLGARRRGAQSAGCAG